MKIDWNEAPEGFPLWLEGTNEEHRKHSGWYRQCGLVYEGSHGGQWRGCREGQFFTVHRKPAHEVWTGEGLPPVGTVCDWSGETVTILTHVEQPDCRDDEYRNLALGQKGERGSIVMGPARSFKPIRTPEQIIADREREERIKAAQKWLDGIAQEYGADVADKCEDILMAAEERRKVGDV